MFSISLPLRVVLRIQNILHPSQFRSFYILVPPNITDAPKKIVEAEEGGSVILTCHASGTKPYVVTWFYNGDSSGLPLYSTVGYDGSLFLRKISARYQGRYTCRVKNAAGSVSHETRIIVSKCSQCFLFTRNFFRISISSTLRLPLI